MGRIVIYSQLGCPYCSRVKLALDKRQRAYLEIDVDKNPKQWEKLQMINPNITSLPQIFFNYEYIGGAKEFLQMEEDGTLDSELEIVFKEEIPFELPFNTQAAPTPSPTNSQTSDRTPAFSGNKYDESSTDISISADIDDEEVEHLKQSPLLGNDDIQKKIEDAFRSWSGKDFPLASSLNKHIDRERIHRSLSPPSSLILNDKHSKKKKDQIKRAIKEWAGEEEDVRKKKHTSNKRFHSITHSDSPLNFQPNNNNHSNNNNSNSTVNNTNINVNGSSGVQVVSQAQKNSQQLWEINSVLSGNLFFKMKKSKLSFDMADLTSSESNHKLRGNDRWKICWFVLKDGHLLCFREKNPKECFPIHSFCLKSAIISQYSLKSSITITQDPPLSSSTSTLNSAFVEDTPSPYYFSLLIYSGSGYHNYQFCCKSEVDFNRWVNSITFVIKNYPFKQELKSENSNKLQKNLSPQPNIFDSVEQVLVTSTSSEIKEGKLAISLHDPFITFWNKFLKYRLNENKKKLSVKLKQNCLVVGQSFTITFKKIKKYPLNNCNILPSIIGNYPIEKYKGYSNNSTEESNTLSNSNNNNNKRNPKKKFCIYVNENEACWLYVNSNYPHAYQIYYNDTPTLSEDQIQNYFVTPKQHWIPGITSPDGRLKQLFISNPNSNVPSKLRIKITPLLRHDVCFSICESSKDTILPSNAWNLYDTPEQYGLTDSDSIWMNFNQFPNSKMNFSLRNTNLIKFVISNLSLSRRHIVTIERMHKCKQIKEMLNLLSEIPSSQQTLLYCNKPIDDNKVINSVFPEDENTISLTWLISPNPNASPNSNSQSPSLSENHPLSLELTNDGVYSLYNDERGEKAWDYQRSREITVFLVHHGN